MRSCLITGRPAEAAPQTTESMYYQADESLPLSLNQVATTESEQRCKPSKAFCRSIAFLELALGVAALVLLISSRYDNTCTEDAADCISDLAQQPTCNLDAVCSLFDTSPSTVDQAYFENQTGCYARTSSVFSCLEDKDNKETLAVFLTFAFNITIGVDALYRAWSGKEGGYTKLVRTHCGQDG